MSNFPPVKISLGFVLGTESPRYSVWSVCYWTDSIMYKAVVGFIKHWRLFNHETSDVYHEGWGFFEPDHRASYDTTHTLSVSSSFVRSSKFDYKVKLTRSESSCQSACTTCNGGVAGGAGLNKRDVFRAKYQQQ
jgi:hypothetical protein